MIHFVAHGEMKLDCSQLFGGKTFGKVKRKSLQERFQPSALHFGLLGIALQKFNAPEKGLLQKNGAKGSRHHKEHRKE